MAWIKTENYLIVYSILQLSCPNSSIQFNSMESSSSSSATSSPNSKQVTDSGERNWVDLPRDAVLSIFRKLDSIDILIRPYNVCTIWREISKDPSLYCTINMPNSADPNTKWGLLNLCYRAVDYSFGHIIHINIDNFATDALLHHIANS